MRSVREVRRGCAWETLSMLGFPAQPLVSLSSRGPHEVVFIVGTQRATPTCTCADACVSICVCTHTNMHKYDMYIEGEVTSGFRRVSEGSRIRGPINWPLPCCQNLALAARFRLQRRASGH